MEELAALVVAGIEELFEAALCEEDGAQEAVVVESGEGLDQGVGFFFVAGGLPEEGEGDGIKDGALTRAGGAGDGENARFPEKSVGREPICSTLSLRPTFSTTV